MCYHQIFWMPILTTKWKNKKKTKNHFYYAFSQTFQAKARKVCRVGLVKSFKARWILKNGSTLLWRRFFLSLNICCCCLNLFTSNFHSNFYRWTTFTTTNSFHKLQNCPLLSIQPQMSVSVLIGVCVCVLRMFDEALTCIWSIWIINLLLKLSVCVSHPFRFIIGFGWVSLKRIRRFLLSKQYIFNIFPVLLV